MLPTHITAWLKSFDFASYTEAIRAAQSETRKTLDALSLSPESEIGDFYLNYGALSAPGWYEILEVDDLADMADYIHEEFELPVRFIALTAHEGGGFSLMDRDSGSVYDVTFDEIDDMLEGRVEPVGKSFAEYLEWRRTNRTETA